jgi:hypothetical protein
MKTPNNCILSTCAILSAFISVSNGATIAWTTRTINLNITLADAGANPPVVASASLPSGAFNTAGRIGNVISARSVGQTSPYQNYAHDGITFTGTNAHAIVNSGGSVFSTFDAGQNPVGVLGRGFLFFGADAAQTATLGSGLAGIQALTIGNSYRIQILMVNVSSGGNSGSGLRAIMDGIDLGRFSSPYGPASTAMIVEGTFTADSTTQTFLWGSTATNGGAEGAYGSGWVFDRIPEPSVALIGSVGALMLLRRRRV